MQSRKSHLKNQRSSPPGVREKCSGTRGTDRDTLIINLSQKLKAAEKAKSSSEQSARDLQDQVEHLLLKLHNLDKLKMTEDEIVIIIRSPFPDDRQIDP